MKNHEASNSFSNNNVYDIKAVRKKYVIKELELRAEYTLTA